MDSSVLLAAAGSAAGASRLLITAAKAEGWDLVTSDYCLRETEHNVSKAAPRAALLLIHPREVREPKHVGQEGERQRREDEDQPHLDPHHAGAGHAAGRPKVPAARQTGDGQSAQQK